MRVVNLYADEWERSRDRPGWQWQHRDVDGGLGAEKIGASLYELAPGQRTFPYHWHAAEEEWLIVVSGAPTLRDPSGERVLAAGDCVVFARGPDGAHAIRNDTDEAVRLLLLSSKTSDADICLYPDSGKAGIHGKDLFWKVLDESAELDYFTGEE